MVAPLNAYMQRHLGHPVINNPSVGYDPAMSHAFGDDTPMDAYEEVEFGADYNDMVGRGIVPRRAWQAAIARMRARRQARREARQANPIAPHLTPQFRRPGGRPAGRCVFKPYGVGVDYLEGLGADDDIDEQLIAAENAEIDALEEDDEDVFGADGEEEVGSTVTNLDGTIAVLDAKIAKTEQRLENVPRWRLAWRGILKARLARLKRVRERKLKKKARKVKKLAAKLGIPAGAAMAAAAGGAAAGGTVAALSKMGVPPSYINATEQQMMRAAAANAMGIQGRYSAFPYEGVEVPIPILFGGLPYLDIPVGIGATGDFAIAGISGSISYADFEVIGVRAKLQVNPGITTGFWNDGVLTSCRLNTFQVDGGINLLYGSTALDFAGGVNNAQAPTLTSTARVSGLRDNPTLDRTNTITLNATFRNHLANGAAFNAVFEAAAICRRKNDPAAQRSI